jgi:hypothetical protein
MRTSSHRRAGLNSIPAADANGQSIMEFALILPLLLVVVLGVIELGNALFDQHIVTKLAREGANLISRSASIKDAEDALVTMSNRPVNFTNGTSTVIFSVITRGATGANNNHLFLSQRRVSGTLPATSKIEITGSGAFGGQPDYLAVNGDNNPGLRLRNPPPNLAVAPGSQIYVTEVFSRHPLLTPLPVFGVVVPPVLYSISYF